MRLGGEGDNWHMTWTSDDRLVAGLCDGTAKPWPNVPRKLYNSRLISIRGLPPKLEFSDTPGYPELLVGPGPRDNSRYYNFGILATGGAIYQFLSTPDRPFDNNAPHPRFIGAKLIYSPDNGTTWHNQDGSTPVRWEPWEDRSKRNMAFFKEPDNAFSLLTLLQMGQNYEQNADGYVYIYSPNGSTEGTMNQLVLCRVPKDRIPDRGAYEFFVARQPDGTARVVERHRGPRRGEHVSDRLGEHEDSPVRLASERRLRQAIRRLPDGQLGHGLRGGWNVVWQAQLPRLLGGAATVGTMDANS